MCKLSFLTFIKFRSLFFPDIFLPHGKPEEQYEEANLLAKDIAYCALQTLGSNYSKKEIDLAWFILIEKFCFLKNDQLKYMLALLHQ